MSGCLPFLQLAVLLVVYRLGPICAYRVYRVLCDAGLGVEESAVYTVIQRMRSRGLLEVVEVGASGGRRVKRYRLTSSGLRELERLLGDYERLRRAIDALLAENS